MDEDDRLWKDDRADQLFRKLGPGYRARHLRDEIVSLGYSKAAANAYVRECLFESWG